ncbi:MAG: hypothetical protein AAF481_11900 [Acidobacteriota bacterium]
MTFVGVLLFLFIPLVLYLFVAHPEPLGGSLAAGVLLMIGHRFLARPYMARVRPHQCLWCNRLDEGNAREGGAEPEALPIAAGGNPFRAVFCAGHRRPAERFLRWVERFRWPLRLGIFLPLLFLLGSLLFAALGYPAPVERATAVFRLVVGLTVQFAALGAWWGEEGEGVVTVPFPAHNFYLLGIRILLWIFRLVGVWWIVAGARALFR